MKRIVLTLISLMLFSQGWADSPLVWQTPMGTFGLPFNATEALLGYDGILKQALAGMSLPVYTDPHGLVALQVGAVAPWQNANGATIQPYLGIGHDLAREIPILSQYQSFHLNAFARYDTGAGKAGAGIGVSYGFAGGTITPTNPPTPPVSTAVPAPTVVQ